MISELKERENFMQCQCGCKFIYDDKALKPLMLHPGCFYLMCPKCNNQTIFVAEPKVAKKEIILEENADAGSSV